MKQEYNFKNNKEEQQYQLSIDDYTAFIDYQVNADGDVFLTHTEVPSSLEGRGVGTRLVEETLEDIEKQGQHVVPLCDFVISYMRKHPEWNRIIAQRK